VTLLGQARLRYKPSSCASAWLFEPACSSGDPGGALQACTVWADSGAPAGPPTDLTAQPPTTNALAPRKPRTRHVLSVVRYV
jgi:hypothetical protein